MGTKNEPGKHDCHARAEADEPTFTLLGRDPTAHILVLLWCALRVWKLKGADQETLRKEQEKIEEAKRCASAMQVWALKKRGEEVRVLVSDTWKLVVRGLKALGFDVPDDKKIARADVLSALARVAMREGSGRQMDAAALFLQETRDEVEREGPPLLNLLEVREAAQNLFDNRLGHGSKRPPFAPRSFWATLGAALYGEGDSRVAELRE